MNEEAVRQFLGARLAAFKVPRYVSFTEEPLPRNATEKVLKKDVRHAFISSHDLH
jgi:long-chain acyl-CoA synthetase